MAICDLPAEIAAVLAGELQWCVVHGDAREILPLIPEQSIDAAIIDPPYSKHVHESVRRARRRELPDLADAPCRTRRTVDLGFGYLDAPSRRLYARHLARLVRRWSLAFSDVESAHLWRISLVAAGLRYKRTGEWRRIGGAPQFSGDRPAAGFEAITIAHPAGRSRWNGGGKAASYEHPIVANRAGQRGSRLHPTQKPEPLMVELVDDFSDRGEIVIDFTCGSGTTGSAAIRRGRRFIGIERIGEHAQTARARLAATIQDDLIVAPDRAKQVALFSV